MIDLVTLSKLIRSYDLFNDQIPKHRVLVMSDWEDAHAIYGDKVILRTETRCVVHIDEGDTFYEFSLFVPPAIHSNIIYLYERMKILSLDKNIKYSREMFNILEIIVELIELYGEIKTNCFRK